MEHDIELNPNQKKIQVLKDEIENLTESVSNMGILKQYGIIIPENELAL